jgi:release factor glutamine methyltransferase
MPDIITIQNLLKTLSLQLQPFSTTPVLDSEIIICHVLNKNKLWLLKNPLIKIKSPKILKQIFYLTNQRKDGKPISYITHQKEFYNLSFFVDENVLIPRPETELLVDLTLEKIKKNVNLNVIDIGTGSGCIITAIYKNIKNKQHFFFGASDISKKALKIAHKNFSSHQISKNIHLIHANLFSFVQKITFPFNNFLIVSNLPYLSYKQYLKTSNDVQNYEPAQALWTKKNGIYLIEQLIKQVNHFLIKNQNSSITLFLEFDPNQKQLLTGILRKYPLFKHIFHKDLSQKIRVIQLDTPIFYARMA